MESHAWKCRVSIQCRIHKLWPAVRHNFQGVLKRHEAITFFIGKISTYLVKVSMMTNTHLNWWDIVRVQLCLAQFVSMVVVWKERILSPCVVYPSSDTSHSWWLIPTSCRRFGHTSAAESREWFCVNIANVRSTPLCPHSHSWHSVMSYRSAIMWCIIASAFSTRRLNASTRMLRVPGIFSMMAL